MQSKILEIKVKGINSNQKRTRLQSTQKTPYVFLKNGEEGMWLRVALRKPYSTVEQQMVIMDDNIFEILLILLTFSPLLLGTDI